MADLIKAGLAIPPQVAQLQDIKRLNRLALEKAYAQLSVNPNPVPNGITAVIGKELKLRIVSKMYQFCMVEVKLLYKWSMKAH